MATYNLDNLDPGDGPARFARLGKQIAVGMGAPDILAVQEVQDNDGPRDDGVTRADKTFRDLVRAVVAAGGPSYRVASIAPLNDADGGEPGGNIRLGFLYKPRHVRLMSGDAGSATDATVPVLSDSRLTLSFNPGRVAPTAGAFKNSRKPLAALFRVGKQRLLAVDVHLTARRGGDPDWGRFQPPRLGGARKRRQQIRVLSRFVRRVWLLDPDLPVVVLGDFNAQAFEAALQGLAGRGADQLSDLLGRLAPTERYSYIFRGNGEALDHVYVTQRLRRSAWVSVLHLNSARRHAASDHDPVLVRLHWPSPGAGAMLH